MRDRKKPTLRPRKAFACTDARYQLTGHCKPTNDGDMEPVVIVSAADYRLTKVEREVVEAAINHIRKREYNQAEATVSLIRLKNMVSNLERANGRK